MLIRGGRSPERIGAGMEIAIAVRIRVWGSHKDSYNRLRYKLKISVMWALASRRFPLGDAVIAVIGLQILEAELRSCRPIGN
jgi:hypothetical protein